MFERVQSALRTVKDFNPRSMVPHKVSEVRKDSPAGRDGHLKVGDRVEGVDGRSIGHMSPREITQLFRKAGNKIRLRILSKSETDVESVSEAAEIEVDEKRTPSTPVTQGPRAPQPLGSRDPEGQVEPAPEGGQCQVELQRGPTGFGFSLRGGSEYKMNIYVRGMMAGGPAERSGKIQVSDQLLEINGTSTAGLSHAEAVEQIRSGGNRIKLLLRRGNGFIPDYDTQAPRSASAEALPEVGSRTSRRDLDPEPPEGSRGPGGPEASTRASAPHRGTPREDQGGHQGGRRETPTREGRPRGRRSGVRGETPSEGRSQPPRECQSLSPLRDRGASSLLGPRLRPSVEAGPWLVPSPERLSHTLRKDSRPPRGQRAQGGFAGGFLGLEAGEREKREALW